MAKPHPNRPPAVLFDRCPYCGGNNITFEADPRTRDRFARCDGSRGCGRTFDYGAARRQGDEYRRQTAPETQRFLDRKREERNR